MKKQLSECPYCGSEDFEVETQQFQQESFIAVMKCNSCKKRFEELYKFVKTTKLDEV